MKEIIEKLRKEFEKKDLNTNLLQLHEFTELLLSYNDFLADNVDKIEEWQKYFDALLIKFCFHAFSLHKVLSGIEFHSKYHPEKKIEILDISSGKALLRAQFETFLMFHHIYVIPKSDDEKQLRYCAWIHAALVRRQEYSATTEESLKQKNLDKIKIDGLKSQMKSLTSYTLLSEKQKKQLMDKGSGKLFTHWESIIEDAGVGNGTPLQRLYEYLSIYSHSEGLSVIQLKSTKFHPKDPHNQSQAYIDLSHSTFLVCIMIKELVHMYPILKPKFEELSSEMKFKVDLFSQFTKTNVA